MKKKTLLIAGLVAAIGAVTCACSDEEPSKPASGIVADDKEDMITEGAFGDESFKDEIPSDDLFGETETDENGQPVTDSGKDNNKDNEQINVDIIMVGDILLHDRLFESGLMEDGTYNYDHMFKKTKDEISAADIAIVNQEVILGGLELGLSGYPSFNAAYEVGDSLVNAGFDVVLHATNHALDKRKKGLLNCLNFWDTKYPNIGVLGIHDTKEDAEEIYIKEVEGIKIAILNYTYSTNGVPMPDDMPYAVDMWDEKAIKADVEKAKTMADFIVVCPHWGTEYVFEETKDQQKKAQFLADLGVDLILGTHPHVVEPVKWLKGKEGNDTLVYYSIGNFINATGEVKKGVAARMLGAMAKVTLTTDGKDVWIAKYGVEPLVTHLVEGSGKITTYKLSKYTKELEALNEMELQDDSFSIEYCQDICKDVFGDLYNSDVVCDEKFWAELNKTGEE